MENFKEIPGYTRYEYNGKVVRNKVTEATIGHKSGTSKFYILGDDNVRKLLSAAEIDALMAKVPATPAKKEEVKTHEKPAQIKVDAKGGKEAKPKAKSAPKAKATKKEKPAKKAPAKKAVKKAAPVKDDYTPTKEVQKCIDDETKHKHEKIMFMIGKNVPRPAIARLLEVTPGNISRTVWGYKNKLYPGQK